MVFTGEPTRESLTQPPTGYQTPAPNAPYGVVGEEERAVQIPHPVRPQLIRGRERLLPFPAARHPGRRLRSRLGCADTHARPAPVRCAARPTVMPAPSKARDTSPPPLRTPPPSGTLTHRLPWRVPGDILSLIDARPPDAPWNRPVNVRRLAMVAILAAAGAAAAVSPAPAAGPDVAQFELANGMKVMVIPDHRTPVVTHMVWYQVGSADEQAGKSASPTSSSI